ncbi:MAG: amidohydrolase [Desulfobacterota bacterium]|nr:amidohydrolase [Thermodesulfobacteriota bacterium]
MEPQKPPSNKINDPPLDYLIRDAQVLPLSSLHPGPIPRGYVGLRGSVIACVGEGAPEDWTAREVIEASGFLAMPGLVNTHTHAAMTLFRGLADDLPLRSWLEDHIFPAEARIIDAETVYWGSLLACAEMIRSGTTTFADGYFCLEGTARAVQEAGLRAVLAHGIIDFPAPGVPDPADNIATVRRFIDRWAGVSELIRLGVFPHAAYTCSPATLKQAKGLAREHRLPLFIHLAETREEVDRVRQISGTSPVRFLRDLDLLDSRTVAVHANWLEAEELDLLAETRTGVSHCPESNLKLAAGVAPIVEMLERGIPVGLGTDGCASNNDLDLLREMRTAALLHKVTRRDPALLSAPSLVRLVTITGAVILGLEQEVGTLEAGKQADLILVDLDRPHLTPLYNPFSHLVYAACGADVDTVFVAGRPVMRRRELLTLDWREIRDRVREIAKRAGG